MKCHCGEYPGDCLYLLDGECQRDDRDDDPPDQDAT